MVYEEREINKYQSTKGVIADLQVALEEGYKNFEIETHNELETHSEYGMNSYSRIVVSRTRPETQAEQEARELRERLKDQEQFNREQEQYKRLKAKFGNL